MSNPIGRSRESGVTPIITSPSSSSSSSSSSPCPSTTTTTTKTSKDRNGRRSLVREGTSGSLTITTNLSNLKSNQEAEEHPAITTTTTTTTSSSSSSSNDTDETTGASVNVVRSTIDKSFDPSGFYTGFHVPLPPKASVPTSSLTRTKEQTGFVESTSAGVDFVSHLPFELALCIIYHLPSHQDVLNAAMVNKVWRSVAMDNIIWREFFFRNPGWGIRDDAEMVLEKRSRSRRSESVGKGKQKGEDPGGGGGGGGTEIPFSSRSADRKRGKEKESEGANHTPNAKDSPSKVKTWRETLHLPSLPDLSGLHLGGVGATTNPSGPKQNGNGGAVNVDEDPRSRRVGSGSRSNLEFNEDADATTSPVRSASSSRFSFFSSPVRGPSTPAGIKRAAAQASSLSPSENDAFGGEQRPGSWSGAAADSSFTIARPKVNAEDEDVDDEGESVGHTLDWPKLYADRLTLERRWNPYRYSPGGPKVVVEEEEEGGEEREAGGSSGGAGVVKGKEFKFHPTKRYLRGHEDSVYCVRFDPGIGTGSSGRIISGSRDKTIKIWDADSFRLDTNLLGHSGSVLCLQHDERMLVSGSSDATVRVWDYEAICRLRQETEVNEGQAVVLDINAKDGGEGREETGVTREEGNERWLKIVGKEARSYVLAVLRGHEHGILDVALGTEWILSCSKDSTVRVWKRGGEFELHRKYTAHQGPVNAASLQGDQVVTASGDGCIHLWQVESGVTLRTFSGHERGLACVVFKGEKIISGSNDQTIRTWDSKSGECKSRFQAHNPLVRALSYHPHRNLILSGGYDRMIRLWDSSRIQANQPPSVVRQLKLHSARIFDVQILTSFILSASEDQRICVTSFDGQGIDASLFV
ncbi:WD40 repeat-like protein [Violaceomyces palustris]|uniref:WD40 repeat-like protein n=1 Tax=Violaceomyces palustris TaxID=1673888 RepID=A0ACD0NP91_9BASI|nr:WD40 repeat-like protein [Violaceomyces palustris]